MRVALIISCLNSKSAGNGGHYYSMLETAFQLARDNNIIIISVGDTTPKAFNAIEYKYYHYQYKFNILGVLNEVKARIKKESIDVLHAFDEIAFLWVRIISNKYNIPSCLTKCGGKNPRYYPVANDLILFSKENESFFNTKKRFAKTKTHLLPNRIRPFSSSFDRIENIDFTISKHKDSFKFLRIVRIGKYYHSSSVQLINLVNRLNEDNIKCCAIFIGSIEDQIYFEDLKARANHNIYFFNSNTYTYNAKELIDVADAVLGTGRSFMEASSKGKILLTPNYNADLPALITNDNFDDAFYYNFSERIEFKAFDKETNYLKLKALIRNTENRTVFQQLSLSFFEKYFNSELISKKLVKIYKNANSSKINIIDIVLHLLFVLRKSILK